MYLCIQSCYYCTFALVRAESPVVVGSYIPAHVCTSLDTIHVMAIDWSLILVTASEESIDVLCPSICEVTPS